MSTAICRLVRCGITWVCKLQNTLTINFGYLCEVETLLTGETL